LLVSKTPAPAGVFFISIMHITPRSSSLLKSPLKHNGSHASSR
jgi:hypothetical protein